MIELIYLLAGSNVRGNGQDNKFGWFPVLGKVTPEDFEHIILHALGSSNPNPVQEHERLDIIKAWNSTENAHIVFLGKWNDGKRGKVVVKSGLIHTLNNN